MTNPIRHTLYQDGERDRFYPSSQLYAFMNKLDHAEKDFEHYIEDREQLAGEPFSTETIRLIFMTMNKLRVTKRILRDLLKAESDRVNIIDRADPKRRKFYKRMEFDL